MSRTLTDHHQGEKRCLKISMHIALHTEIFSPFNMKKKNESPDGTVLQNVLVHRGFLKMINRDKEAKKWVTITRTLLFSNYIICKITSPFRLSPTYLIPPLGSFLHCVTTQGSCCSPSGEKEICVCLVGEGEKGKNWSIKEIPNRSIVIQRTFGENLSVLYCFLSLFVQE